ncbi:T9SS type A sorting domain-containing protein [bacterium]|nr:T9SS type A sorting domain-containing protein [bacterium]
MNGKMMYRLAVTVIFVTSAAAAQNVWIPVGSGSGNTLTQVRFFNEAEGWIRGDNGTMLMTADSGNTWHPVADAAPYYIDDVQFVNASTGYGCTSYVWGPSAGTTLFFRTYDGGENWDVEALDLDYAWLDPMFFFDAGHGWMFVNSGPFVGSVMITRDSARTWHEYAFTMPSAGSTDGTRITDFSFSSPAAGWACGWRKTTVGGNPGWKDCVLFHTIDGGEHWNTAVLDYAIPRKIVGLDDQCAWVIVVPFSAYDPLDYTIARTTDGGSVWETLNGTPLLNSFWFANADSGWGVSDHSVYITRDGGAAWEIVYTDESVRFQDIDFYSGTGCIVGDDGLILQYRPSNTAVDDSHDAGPSSFTLLQNYPNPFNAMTKIAFDLDRASATEIRIVDLNGRLVKTIDKGVLNTGRHNVIWNASSEPSGVYCITVQAGDDVQTIKCLLVR